VTRDDVIACAIAFFVTPIFRVLMQQLTEGHSMTEPTPHHAALLKLRRLLEDARGKQRRGEKIDEAAIDAAIDEVHAAREAQLQAQFETVLGEETCRR
jgi:hypothetical protein